MIINSLINVINSTNTNTEKIFNNIQNLEQELQKINLDNNDKIKFDYIISNLYFLLQNQDLHQQELTSVIHNIGEKDNLDLSSYNLAHIKVETITIHGGDEYSLYKNKS